MSGPKSGVWLAWEVHQRSRSLASALGFSLAEFDIQGSRALRYAKSTALTIRTIVMRKPRVVIVQAPSVVGAVVAIVLSIVFRFQILVDAHNVIIEDAEHGKSILAWLSRQICRWPDYVIVTNSALARRVSSLGGRPLVLPDPVPSFRNSEEFSENVGEIVVISSWADDEPIAELFAAAELLDDSLIITITGKPKGQFSGLLSTSRRIKASGYLRRDQYLKMISNASVIVDLTTREDCLVCGAYEALAFGRPLVVSDTAALRELLGSGAIYCSNESRSIAEAIERAFRTREISARNTVIRRESYISEWNLAAKEVVAVMGI